MIKTSLKFIQGAIAISLGLVYTQSTACAVEHQVLIQGFKFVPAEVSIRVGDTVRWVQKDAIPHNVVSDTTPRVLDGPLLGLEQSYSFTFTEAGAFPYHCAPHPNMKGTVRVAAVAPATPIHITRLESSGPGLTIGWAGGTAPYLLQSKSQLTQADWQNVLSTSSLNVMVPRSGPSGYYRVVDQASATVVPFSVLLGGGAEVPAVTTSGSGSGQLALDGMRLSYRISYEGLTSEATAAHVHGTADATHSAGVLFPLTGASGVAGVLSGSQTLTAEQYAAIVGGLAYVNIHTANHPSGEVRGQIVPLRIPVNLSGAAEPSPVNTPGFGDGTITLIGNAMFYEIEFSNLAAEASAAHLHGPAQTGQSAGVLFPLSGASGVSNSLKGDHILSLEQLTNVLAGLTYVNIHTSQNPAGEIRGQVAPFHFHVALSGAAQVPAVSSAGSGSGSIALSGNVLTYTIHYADLTSAASAAHIHGPADVSQSAGVLFPLPGAAGTSGTLSGSQMLAPDQVVAILSGKSYVNIHTANHPGGEIRGQLKLHD